MAAAGTVAALYTSAADGDTDPMEGHGEIECVAGLGIRGDRYALDHRGPSSHGRIAGSWWPRQC